MTVFGRGHYDIIYQHDEATKVFLQTDTPQYLAPYQHGFVKGLDAERVGLHSFIFPAANIRLAEPMPDSSASSSIAFSHDFQPPHPQPMLFGETSIAQSYFPTIAQAFSQAHQQHQPPAPAPNPSLSLPVRSYSSTMMGPNSQLSPSTQSPSSPSPHPPSPGVASPLNIPNPNQPLIRYNPACHNYQRQGHQSLPLDPGSFGR